MSAVHARGMKGGSEVGVKVIPHGPWVSAMYEVSKNVFGKAVLSLVAEFQK